MTDQRLIIPDHLQNKRRYILPEDDSDPEASFLALPEGAILSQLFKGVFPQLAAIAASQQGVPSMLASGTNLLWCFAAEAKDRLLGKLTKVEQKIAALESLESRVAALESSMGGQDNA